MREANRVTKQQAIKMAEEANFTPKQFENKVRQLLVEAKNAGTIDGWWRDLDRSNPTENKRRMRGMLDFTVFFTLPPMPVHLYVALPSWKQDLLQTVGGPINFSVYLECKTGRGKPNAAQEVSIDRANRNPGCHAFVVYPHDLPWIRKVLGI